MCVCDSVCVCVVYKNVFMVLLVTCQAQVVQVLWYSYSELHVLLWLDILQSATEQKDAVADICRRGALSVDIAKSFGDVCCKAIEKGCQQWKAEVCNWGEDEQSERLARFVGGGGGEGGGIVCKYNFESSSPSQSLSSSPSSPSSSHHQLSQNL